MQMATPRTNQIDRELREVRASMGDRHLLNKKVERKTPKPTADDLRHRWEQLNKMARGI